VAGEALVRAFFGIELDAALRREAALAAHDVRERIRPDVEVRWTRKEGWHVTLRFLGNVAVGRLGDLIAVAREALAAVAPFDLRLGATTAFPSRRARVLALDVMPHAPLAAAAAALDGAAVGCGFASEGFQGSEGFEERARVFRPHLTIGRVKRGSLRARDIETGTAAGEASQSVEEIVLFQSELRSSGARYTPLERIALGENDHP